MLLLVLQKQDFSVSRNHITVQVLVCSFSTHCGVVCGAPTASAMIVHSMNLLMMIGMTLPLPTSSYELKKGTKASLSPADDDIGKSGLAGHRP